MTPSKAIDAINRRGALLVFPMDNASEPPSLWSEFFPKSPMRWEWDENGDDRVARLWHLRTVLSSSNKVVYTKWYRGRATFFSKKLFTAFLQSFISRVNLKGSVSPEALEILELLENESPLSTKVLKKNSGLSGRANESKYQKRLKELWTKLLIVGFGEVEEGAFPSLAIGATRILFEELWVEALNLSSTEARKIIHGCLPNDSLFLKQFYKVPKASTKQKKEKPVEYISFEDL